MAEESNPVDLVALSTEITEFLGDARREFEVSLERVQSVINEIEWEQLRKDTLISEIGEVTFSNYESVEDLLKRISFRPISERKLLETDIQKSKKHVFESESLDAAEAAVISVTSAAGDGEFKNLAGVYLSNAMREALRSSQNGYDLRDHNDQISLLNRYQSSDHTGNQAWLVAQFALKVADRDRNIFSTLFEMAQANVQWAFQNGIGIEQLHEGFTARYNKLYLDITSANIAAYKAEVKANISELEAELKEVDTIMRVESLKFDAESAEWALRIDQANNRMKNYVQEFSGKLARNLKMVNTRMVGGKNVADGYKSIFSAYSSQYSGVSLSNSSE